MNNDYLRLNSKTDDEEIVTSEFDVEQEKVEKPAEKKLTVWSILFYGRKKHGQKSGVDLPTFKGCFTVFLAISFIAVFLLFIALINKNTEFLIVDAFILAILFPVSSITLFFDLNTKKNVSITEILSAVIIGVFVYLLAILIRNFLYDLFADYKTIASIITHVMIDAMLFVTAYIYVKLMKKDDIFSAILVCICIYSGYLVMRTSDSLMNSLFVNIDGVKVIVFGGDPDAFARAANYFVGTIFNEGLYFPALTIFWAIICASIIGLTALPFKEVREHGATYLLFLIIQIALHLISYYDSTIPSLELLISIMCFIASLFCAVRMLNYALSKSKILKPRED